MRNRLTLTGAIVAALAIASGCSEKAEVDAATAAPAAEVPAPAEARTATAPETLIPPPAEPKCGDVATDGYALIESTALGAGCYSPSSTGGVKVRTVLNADTYVTSCPVVIDNAAYTLDKPCKPTGAFTQPIATGDQIEIRKTPSGYALDITGTNDRTVPLSAATGADGATTHLYSTAGNVQFFVYFANRPLVSGDKLERYYRIEIFAPTVDDSTQCDLHKPGTHSTTPNCDVVAVAGLQPQQTGVSTGGEPPIR